MCLLLCTVVFLLFFAVGYPLTPKMPDCPQYYFTACSNVKYIQESLFGNAGAFLPERCAEEHIVPCTISSPKPLFLMVMTLFVALLPTGYEWLAIGQALIATGVCILLVSAARIARRTSGDRGGMTDREALLSALPFIAAFSLSGSVLYYCKEFSPPLFNSFAIALCAIAYLAYKSQPSLGRASLLGFSASVAFTAHLSTVPFVGAFVAVEGIALFMERRTRTWREVLVHFSVASVSFFVLPTLIQLFTWLPTLWMKDPYAWKYTAYYGLPYQSYLDILKWYVAVAVESATSGSDVSRYQRFINIAMHLTFLAGPVVVLAALGWIWALVRIVKDGWNAGLGLLAAGPAIAILWYTLQKDIVLVSYALAPFDVYIALLAGYACLRCYQWGKTLNRTASRMAVLAFPILILLAQTVHLIPLFTHKAAYSSLEEWLNARGENSIVALVRQGQAEAAGLTTWGFATNIHGWGSEWEERNAERCGHEPAPGTVAAWGELRPAISWESDELPRYVSVTQPDFLKDTEREFLRHCSIDLAEPVVRFQILRTSYFYSRNYGIISDIMSVINPASAKGIGETSEGLLREQYMNGICVYEVRRTRNDGEED